MPSTPAERHLAAQVAAHESWAQTPDRAARTLPARTALMRKFELEVDPTDSLPLDERLVRAESAMKAHFARLGLASARARRQALEAAAEARRAEAELATMRGGAA